MDILKIAAVILICAILFSSLPTFDKSISSLITLSASVVILLYVINSTKDYIGEIKSVIDSFGTGEFSLVFKIMGISLVTQFVSDIARDSGNKSLANQMVFAGKAAIIVLALPVFTRALEVIGKLLK